MGSPIFDIINVGPFVWFSSTSIVAFRVEPKHTVRDDGSTLSDTAVLCKVREVKPMYIHSLKMQFKYIHTYTFNLAKMFLSMNF